MKRLIWLLLVGATLLLVQQTSASAADFTVNSDADASDAAAGDGVCATATGQCTLRAAVAEAEALSGADAITVPTMTIQLGSPLTLTKSTTVRGADARSTILTSASPTHLVEIIAGDIVLSDLTLGGVQAPSVGGLALRQTGLAASRLQRVRVVDTTVTGSPANAFAPILLNFGEMVIEDSEISGNTTVSGTVVYGGGVYAKNGTTLTLLRSTVHGNTARVTSSGSGSFGGGVMALTGSAVRILDSTISENRAENIYSAAKTGGNVYGPGVTEIRNSIIAGGQAGVSTSNCSSTSITFTGRNIVSDTSCGAASPTRVVADPLLGPLADNGGGTASRVPAVSSPAVDALGCTNGVDQRGQNRPVGAGCDIGAVELGADLTVTAAVSNPTPAPGSDVVASIQVANGGLDAAAGVVLTIGVPGVPGIVSVTPTQGACSVAGPTITCALGTIPRSQNASALVVLRAPGDGRYAVGADGVSTTPERAPGDNATSTSFTVAAGPTGPTVTPAGRCANLIRGTARADRLRGTAGSDRIRAGAGQDVVRGLAGADCLAGGAGVDRIIAGPGRDRVVAGAGGDVVRARDGVRDRISCGAGRDRVFADKSDRVGRDCEDIRRR